MRTERMIWVTAVLVMALGCQQADRAPEDSARKPQAVQADRAPEDSARRPQAVQREAAVPGSAPAPQGTEPRGPADERAVPAPAYPPPGGPFAARGPAPTLRIGRRAQQDGRILDSDQTDMLMAYDTISFSIGVPEIAGGTMVQLSIQDQGTKQEVWHQQKSAAAGDSFVTFELGAGTLSPDDYVAVLAVDNRGVTQHAFKVSAQ